MHRSKILSNAQQSHPKDQAQKVATKEEEKDCKEEVKIVRCRRRNEVRGECEYHDHRIKAG